MSRESEKEDGEIAPVRAPVPERGVPTVSKEKRGPSHTVESRDLLNSEERMRLDLTVMLKEGKKQKWEFEWKLNVVDAAAARRRVLSNAWETSVVLLGDEDGVKSCSDAVEGWKLSQKIADFELGFQAAVAPPEEAVADSTGQGNKDVPETQDFDLVVEGGQFDELRDFMHGMQKENAEFHGAFAAEKAARAKCLLQVSALWAQRAAQKERIEDFTQRLEEELPVRESNIAEKRHTEDAVNVKEKLTEPVKQLSLCVTELKGERVSGKDTVADFNVRLEAAETRAEDVVYERDVRKLVCRSLNADRTRWMKASLASNIQSIASA